MEKTGQRIRYIRELLGLNQDWFAKKLGVTRGAVGNWELEGGIKFENLRRVAQITGASIIWLSDGTGPIPTRADLLMQTQLVGIDDPAFQIRMLREAARLNQHDLAKIAGTSQPQIGRLERGERKITREWAAKLAPHLGTTPERLLFPSLSNDEPTISASAVKAAISVLFHRYLIASGIDGKTAETRALEATDAALELLSNPSEPTLGLSSEQTLRFEVDRLAQALLKD